MRFEAEYRGYKRCWKTKMDLMINQSCDHLVSHMRFLWCTRRVNGIITPCQPGNMPTDKTEMQKQ